jgi:hypothetical protein
MYIIFKELEGDIVCVLCIIFNEVKVYMFGVFVYNI